MSFSQNSKNEILNQNLEKKISLKPFIYGLYLSCGNIKNNSKNIYLFTDLENIYPLIIKLFKNKLKNNEINYENLIKIDEITKIANKNYYEIELNSQLIDNLNINFTKDIQENAQQIISNLDDIKSFCIGAFLGCATSSIKISETPQDITTSGYHLEFDSKNHEFLLLLSEYLAQFDINAKILKRRNNFVLYVKDAEQVSDVLALVGANNSVIELQNEIVKREFRNKINRQTNCESGNITKMVNASMKQIDAIEKIESTIGLSSLAPDLEEVAILRLANPEESLTDLLKLSTLNLTKSGLNHRLRKLISIADNLTWF